MAAQLRRLGITFEGFRRMPIYTANVDITRLDTITETDLAPARD